MPTTFTSYVGPLKNGSQSGPGIDLAVGLSMFPQHATSGPGSLPIPVASVLHDGVIGTAYSETISAQGGVSPYTFAVASGSLPAGLSLNTSTGVISGTPTTAGTSSFTIKATDTNGSTGTTNFSITVAPASGGASNYAFVS